MEFRNRKINIKEIAKAIFCIAAGTAIGLGVYGIFLYFHIDIFGWNLGLIFAPLAAGYSETMIANRLIGENTGAISAFILFIDTTFYSFILKNPTLGWNLITAGSIIVILQAAFPTLVNYLILVFIGGLLSYFASTFRKINKTLSTSIRNQQFFRWEGEHVEDETEIMPVFDEFESNRKLNDLNFYFLTSSDMQDKKHHILGMYQSEVIIEKDISIIKSEVEYAERKSLVSLKEGKDECLVKLAKTIIENGGNCVLDLSMNYSAVGMGDDNIQIIAKGMGVDLII